MFARVGQIGFFLAVVLATPQALAQDVSSWQREGIELEVDTSGNLPGFNALDAQIYLSDQMLSANLTGWKFQAGQRSGRVAPDRVEWHFEQLPYAGGGVRQFIPIPSLKRLFGTHYLVIAEARLYLGGQYQALVSGQALVQGGDRDAGLAAFVIELTQNLLGEQGAYRAVETGAPAGGSKSSGQSP